MEDFGEKLRARRQAAGITKQQLATLSGLSRGTIRNLEASKHLPSPDTMARLRRVKALKYQDQQRPKSELIADGYSPVRLAEELQAAMKSHGATLDQAHLYLEPQSVLDWMRYCSDASYVSNYRDRIPVQAVAAELAPRCRDTGIDVVALGSGDGRTEIRLVAHLLEQLGQPVHLDLVDVSHPLLVSAYRAACDALAGHGVRVHPIHADFYNLRGHEPLTYRAPTDKRRRLWTLLGHTVGNLRDEMSFLRDLASISRAGDLLVLDFQQTEHEAEAEIRANDRLLQGQYSDLLLNWLTGPLRRHLALPEAPQIRSWLNLHCAIPGSYAVQLTATLHKPEVGAVDFQLARFKRYQRSRMSAALEQAGWLTVSQHSYGPPPPRCGLLVMECRGGAHGPESETTQTSGID